jgi:hypothetical protein
MTFSTGCLIKGNKKTTTVIKNFPTSGIPDDKWSINVHAGPKVPANKADSVVIACGDILNPNNSNKVTVKLVPPPV